MQAPSALQLATGMQPQVHAECCFDTAPQVARLLLRGVEAGKYHLPSADVGQNLLVAGMTSLRCEAVALLVQNAWC